MDLDWTYIEERKEELRKQGVPEAGARRIAAREAARKARGLPITKGMEGRGKRGSSNLGNVGQRPTGKTHRKQGR